MTSQSIGPARAPSARIKALDVARFVALVGMMGAHLWMLDASGDYAVALNILTGKAAALFAVLAGVGVALTSNRLLAKSQVSQARWNLFGRGAVLILVGLVLMFISFGPVVILPYYGLIFWLMIPLLTWSIRALLVAAGIWVVVWPVCAFMLRAAVDPVLAGQFEPIHIPLLVAREVLLEGSYPVLTWVSYTVVGLAVGRLILRAHAQRALPNLGKKLLVIGIALSSVAVGLSGILLGPAGGALILARDRPTTYSLDELIYGGRTRPTDTAWWLTTPGPHSGTSFDLAITIGLALAVIGICLVLERSFHARVLTPIVAAGAAPLTIYAAHLTCWGVVIMIWPPTEGIDWWYSSAQLWGIHVAMALIIGIALTLLHRRGPLESLVSWNGRRAATRRGRRDATEKYRPSISVVDSSRTR